MNNKILTIGVIIAVLIVAGYLFSNSGPVVSSQGTSSLEVKPDEVSVYISIQAENKTAQDAQAQYNEISNNLIAYLEREGFNDDELQILGYNLYPEYDYKSNKIIGYTASSQVIVKADNFSQVLPIIDSAVNSNALVSSINFELSDQKQNEYKIQALAAASTDSRAKAQAIASGLGKKLGKLVAVQSEDFNYPGPILYYAASSGKGNTEDARDAGANLSPKDIEVSATITAQYKLRNFF